MKRYKFSYQELIEFIYYRDDNPPVWLLLGQATHASLLAWIAEINAINGVGGALNPATLRIEDALVICAPPMEEGIIRGIWRISERGNPPFGFRDLTVQLEQIVVHQVPPLASQGSNPETDTDSVSGDKKSS